MAYNDECYYCSGYANYDGGNQDGFKCKNCKEVIHIQCLRQYKLMSDGGATWKCPNCGCEQRALK